MAVKEAEVADFAKRYHAATGNFPKRFVCPITLLDEPDAELCDGHILCEGLESANNVTVIQRAIVDNRFGSVVERDFVKFANFRNAKTEEMLRTVKKFSITSPSGEKMPAFFAGDEAKVCFQQIEMYDEFGKTVATPYLESHTLEIGKYKQLQIEWMFKVHKFCFTAAMLKSAFLNMFRLLGYSWVLDTSGDKVRRTLAESFNTEDRNAALNHFSEFEGCCWIAGNSEGENTPDSLSDDRLLLHYTEGDARNGLLFAVSSVFWINQVLVAVTLPWCNQTGCFFVSWNYYQQFIRERKMCHNIHLGFVVDDVVNIGHTPLSFQIVDDTPPNSTYSHTLSPCPATSSSTPNRHG